MPLFEIEQYELHSTTYRVRADDEAEAIAKVLKGNATMVSNSQELIEVCDDRGLPVEQHQDLASRRLKAVIQLT